ncbi:MAG: exodeoxyribonuclease VII small subunit [Ktedonobacterales bacterium]|nr:exodeoxyribonuclease VII small subunit [Ktedonobacterales bacterium]
MPVGSPLAFEEAQARLEEIIGQLEDSQLPLDHALTLFEEGVRLYHVCQRMLDSAELRMRRLRIVTDESTESGAAFLLEAFKVEER